MTSFIFIYKFGIPLLSSNVDASRYYASNNGGFFYLFVVFGYTVPFVFIINAIYYKRLGNLTFKKLMYISLVIQLLSVLTGYRIFLIILFILVRFP